MYINEIWGGHEGGGRGMVGWWCCRDQLADTGEGARDAPSRGPNSLFFMQFSAENLQDNRLAHPLWELALLRKILDPPLSLLFPQTL